MTRRDKLDLEFTPADQGARLRRRLSKVRGLTLENGYEGEFTAGPVTASVRIEPGDFFRVRHEVEDPPSPCDALETNFFLPGNVRFAVSGERMSVVADTRLDGELHLNSSFGEIGQGLRCAFERPRRGRRKKTQPITPEDVRDALIKTNWPEDAVVQLEDGWELRPRIRGERTPVRLAIQEQGLRVHRVVVTGCDEEARLPMAFQALCFNAQLRHARLAWNGEAVVAETCLHGGLIHSAWLVPAARAVATAWHNTKTTLEILARQAEVARHFQNAFLDAEQQPFVSAL